MCATMDPEGYCARVVIVVVYRQHHWIGMLVAALLWKLAQYLWNYES